MGDIIYIENRNFSWGQGPDSYTKKQCDKIAFIERKLQNPNKTRGDVVNEQNHAVEFDKRESYLQNFQAQNNILKTLQNNFNMQKQELQNFNDLVKNLKESLHSSNVNNESFYQSLKNVSNQQLSDIQKILSKKDHEDYVFGGVDKKNNPLIKDLQNYQTGESYTKSIEDTRTFDFNGKEIRQNFLSSDIKFIQEYLNVLAEIKNGFDINSPIFEKVQSKVDDIVKQNASRIRDIEYEENKVKSLEEKSSQKNNKLKNDSRYSYDEMKLFTSLVSNRQELTMDRNITFSKLKDLQDFLNQLNR